MTAPHQYFHAILLPALLVLASCTAEVAAPPEPTISVSGSDNNAGGKPGRANGNVRLAWQGGARARAGNGGSAARWADVLFDASEPGKGRPAEGRFRFRVVSVDGGIHREITAAVEGVVVDGKTRKVWFIGRVTADSKGCSGGPDSGHGGGCGGDDGGGGGGGGEDDGHDGGCNGGGEGGGGGGNGGGCGDDHGDDGGGCGGGGNGGGGDDHGGSGGPRGASGRTCRVGQVIVGKAHDGGSPAAAYDGITWKWFLADDPDLPAIDDIAAWPHLCRKTITGGNLVVHAQGAGRGKPGHGRP